MLKLVELPNKRINIKQEFSLNINAFVPAFSNHTPLISKAIPKFQFNKQITLCVLAGLVYNKRVLISGAYGAGKSSHIEQACTRLNWPCIRINMDSWITRLELIGKDIITTKNGLYVIKFKYGIIPWAIRKGVSLILDDYDACKPETKFILNKLLEANGEISIPENNKIVLPRASFRIFATCNNIKINDHIGTYRSNPAQLDRWNVVALMNYADESAELRLISKKLSKLLTDVSVLKKISKVASLVRRVCVWKNLQTPLSTRSVISWVELSVILNSVNEAFRYAYLNKCAKEDYKVVTECYNSVFGIKC
ncbi:Cobalamin biosynthesis protein CobS [Candidatus Hodgkinia cicadicola]|nr:Cobalamin biosynthesis protein CobS [Candidatus Hodgkinia cicadicola]